jgi:hypothetical protein
MGQIGTVKLQTENSGVVDVPVFNTGDSGANVYEFLRVQTDSGTGFVPLAAPNNATHDYLRVQSQNHGVVAVHDAASLVSGSLTTTGTKDDFEDGDYTSSPAWNNTGDSIFTVQSGTQYDGTYAVRMDQSGSDGTLNRATSRSLNDGEILSAWTKISTSANDTMFGVTTAAVEDHYNASPRGGWMTCNNGSTYRISTDAVVDGGPSVSNDGSWFGIELEISTSTDEFTLRVYDTNSNLLDSDTVDAGYDISTKSHYVSFGGRTSGNSVYCYFDNVSSI